MLLSATRAREMGIPPLARGSDRNVHVHVVAGGRGGGGLFGSGKA